MAYIEPKIAFRHLRNMQSKGPKTITTFSFWSQYSPGGETVRIFKEPEYLKNQTQEIATDKGPYAWKGSRHLHEFFGKMNY